MSNQIKILVVGDAGVGKTNFINSYFNNQFEQRYIPTEGIVINNFVKYIIYDYAGQEKSGLSNIDLSNIDLCIIMYDVTNKLSYNNIEFWMKNIIKLCGNIQILQVGNKIDNINRKITVNTINISAKTNKNVESLFETIDKLFQKAL
jgi:small GTP-binding protein